MFEQKIAQLNNERSRKKSYSVPEVQKLLKVERHTVYKLEYTYGLNPADISRLKHNHNYTLNSLDILYRLVIEIYTLPLSYLAIAG